MIPSTDGAPPATFAAALAELQTLFGERLSTSRAVREHHGRDFSHDEALLPDVVLFPTSTAEIADAARICTAHRLPIIPFGAGTSVEGQITAPYGGVSIDLSRMCEIVALNEHDLDVTVQPGVTRERLNSYLRDTGLFFPVDPGANATLGGMAATRASGTNAVRYGTMRENVLALTLVLADGSIVHTGTRARKSAAGYDLTRLVVGSEGTLGIIGELTLKLHAQPQAIGAGVCAFGNIDSAVATVIECIQTGIPVARLELLDELSIRAVNSHCALDLRALPTLFVEFHGSTTSVTEQARMFEEICLGHGAIEFEWALDPERRARLWRARHDAAWASRALRPAAQPITTDVCVPISQLAACIHETQQDIIAARLLAPLGGHAGDGNFHVMILVDRSDAAEMQRAATLHRQLVLRALRMGGTCSGEHGIGLGKREFLEHEAGAAGVALMRRVKAAFDPHGLMNPGKIFACGPAGAAP